MQTEQTAGTGPVLSEGLGAWVPCANLLPDSGTDVLVWRVGAFRRLDPGHVSISRCRMTTSGPLWDADQHSWMLPSFLVRRVTHWMPLPDGPQASA